MLDLPLVFRDIPCKALQNREFTELTQRPFVASAIALRSTPFVVRLICYTDLLADQRDRHPVRNQDLRFAELVDDVFC